MWRGVDCFARKIERVDARPRRRVVCHIESRASVEGPKLEYRPRRRILYHAADGNELAFSDVSVGCFELANVQQCPFGGEHSLRYHGQQARLPRVV